MPEPGSISGRLQKLCETAGLSVEEVAEKMNVSPFHIEIPDDEFTCEYSPADVRRFCQILKARPGELFGVTTSEPLVAADELVQLIGAECRKRDISLEQFEDAVGWRLSQCMNPPERLFDEMSLDGVQWLCRELRIDWHRVVLSL